MSLYVYMCACLCENVTWTGANGLAHHLYSLITLSPRHRYMVCIHTYVHSQRDGWVTTDTARIIAVMNIYQ